VNGRIDDTVETTIDRVQGQAADRLFQEGEGDDQSLIGLLVNLGLVGCPGFHPGKSLDGNLTHLFIDKIFRWQIFEGRFHIDHRVVEKICHDPAMLPYPLGSMTAPEYHHPRHSVPVDDAHGCCIPAGGCDNLVDTLSQ